MIDALLIFAWVAALGIFAWRGWKRVELDEQPDGERRTTVWGQDIDFT
jgi:hypothetical protein